MVQRRRWAAWALGAGLALALARWWPPLTSALPLLGLLALVHVVAGTSRLWLASLLPRGRLGALDKRAVLVTGCDSGFGLASALRLDAAGVPVVAGVLLPDGPGAHELRCKASSRMCVLPLDVTLDSSLAAARDRVERHLRDTRCELWAVVNNAGIMAVGESEWMDIDDVRRAIDINLLGQIRVTQYFLPLLKKSKGRIININSLASTTITPTIVPYTISKYASLAYTESLRYDMEKFCISVHSIEPAMYKTPILGNVIDMCKQKLKQIPEDVKSTYCKNYDEKFVNLHYLLLHFMAWPESKTYQVIDSIEDACIGDDPQDHYWPGESSKLIHFVKDFIPIFIMAISKFLYK